VAGRQGAEGRPGAQQAHRSSSSRGRRKLPKTLLTYLLWEPSSLVPSRELLLSLLPQTPFHILQHLSLGLRRVSQRRGWQLEDYVPLRGCGGRTSQAAVAGGQMTGEGSTETFRCWDIPHVQGRWAKLEGMLPWSTCGFRAAVLP